MTVTSLRAAVWILCALLCGMLAALRYGPAWVLVVCVVMLLVDRMLTWGGR